MTSSHHGPYDQGYTRATMAHTKRSDLARASGPHKVRRSPDWSLQLDSMKSESLVIVDQNATVNTFPGLVHTARHPVISLPSRVLNGSRRHSSIHSVTQIG